MAEKIAANAPLTVRAAREMVYLSTEMGRSAALRAGAHLFESVYRSEDAQEGRALSARRETRMEGTVTAMQASPLYDRLGASSTGSTTC
jgi:hypothetical protein